MLVCSDVCRDCYRWPLGGLFKRRRQISFAPEPDLSSEVRSQLAVEEFRMV